MTFKDIWKSVPRVILFWKKKKTIFFTAFSRHKDSVYLKPSKSSKNFFRFEVICIFFFFFTRIVLTEIWIHFMFVFFLFSAIFRIIFRRFTRFKRKNNRRLLTSARIYAEKYIKLDRQVGLWCKNWQVSRKKKIYILYIQ